MTPLSMTFSQLARYAYVPGLDEPAIREAWLGLSPESLTLPEGPKPSRQRLSPMKARRMSPGIRAAVECALGLYEDLTEATYPEAVVMSSRHGEQGRAEKLLVTLSEGEALSPTDFMMSVHNAAGGMLTIEKALTLPVSSVAAGAESFLAGMLEAYVMLGDYERVMVIDFEGVLPPITQLHFPSEVPSLTYAVGCVITRTNPTLHSERWDVTYDYSATREFPVPLSLQYWHALESVRSHFSLTSTQARVLVQTLTVEA